MLQYDMAFINPLLVLSHLTLKNFAILLHIVSAARGVSPIIVNRPFLYNEPDRLVNLHVVAVCGQAYWNAGP